MSGFVLLDRDGVINRRVSNGYVTCRKEFVFLPGALKALSLLEQNGYAAMVVSNQACVGKGLLTSWGLDEITRYLMAKVEERGGRIHGVYYCPHRPEDGCDCRKPKAGLLLKAQNDHGFVFADTFLIGDGEADLRAAYSVGCPSLLVSSEGANDYQGQPYRPRAIFPSLLAAVEFILGTQGRPARTRSTSMKRHV